MEDNDRHDLFIVILTVEPQRNLDYVVLMLVRCLTRAKDA